MGFSFHNTSYCTTIFLRHRVVNSTTFCLHPSSPFESLGSNSQEVELRIGQKAYSAGDLWVGTPLELCHWSAVISAPGNTPIPTQAHLTSTGSIEADVMGPERSLENNSKFRLCWPLLHPSLPFPSFPFSPEYSSRGRVGQGLNGGAKIFGLSCQTAGEEVPKPLAWHLGQFLPGDCVAVYVPSDRLEPGLKLKLPSFVCVRSLNRS